MPVPLLLSISTNMIAQDLRERTYYYEILEPRHEPKTRNQRFCNSKNQRTKWRELLMATLSADGKVSTSVGDYWNKMELTLPSTSTVLQTARHSVYQKIQLKTPVTLLTKLPFEKATYWICALDKKEKVIDTSSKLDVDCSILRNYQSIKLNHNIKAGKIAVADLNGDGIYDYIIRTPEKGSRNARYFGWFNLSN